MRDVLILFVHAIVTIVRLAGQGGLRAFVAESVLVKHQLLILNRGRKRAPNVRCSDRLIAGVYSLHSPGPGAPVSCRSEALDLAESSHRAHQTKVSAAVFTQKCHRPGPKGPTQELIDAVVAMNRRNPTWGCHRIGEQIALAFAVEIDKDLVRRILSTHYRPDSDAQGPSWLTFLGHTKDSLWSCDLFRCESATLRTHWVLVVMDQLTRRIIGFGAHRGTVDGAAMCRIFQRAVRCTSCPSI